MSDRESAINTIVSSKLVAIIRLPDSDGIVESARALADGGFRAIEVTMNTPGALDAIKTLRDELGNAVLIGAGTVRTRDHLESAIEAGAQFIVSPDTNPEVIIETVEAGAVSIPGALTPTEASAACEAGADLVKLFPADAFGPDYLKALRGPLDDIRFIPTGGVRVDNIGEWLDAGAAALAVGSSLVNAERVNAADWDGIAKSASEYVAAVRGHAS